MALFWLSIAASNSVMRKTTRLASLTYNLTSSKLHRYKIIKNDDMGVNIRVSRLMRPRRGFLFIIVYEGSLHLQHRHLSIFCKEMQFQSIAILGAFSIIIMISTFFL